VTKGAETEVTGATALVETNGVATEVIGAYV